MHLYLKSKNVDMLISAHEFLQKAVEPSSLTIKDQASDGCSIEYTVDLPGQDCMDLLNQLLDGFPEVDITGTFIDDVEGRDRSFWSTTRYTSATDEEGKRIFKVDSSTNWC